MMSDIEHCLRMVTNHERRANEAPSQEAAESHRQMAMLYQIQHNVLKGRLWRQWRGED